MDFLVATHNPKKQAELRRILLPLGVSVLTASEAGVELTEVEETGSTFAENAELKAASGCKESGLPCIADDSGLCVDALGGAPGLCSARFAGEHGNDEKNRARLLRMMKGVPPEKRTAAFVCCVCCAFPNGDRLAVKGVCEGRIGFDERGKNGFGYDPLFLVGDRTFAQLRSEDKDRLSHRGRALRNFVGELKRYMQKPREDGEGQA